MTRTTAIDSQSIRAFVKFATEHRRNSAEMPSLHQNLYMFTAFLLSCAPTYRSKLLWYNQGMRLLVDLLSLLIFWGLAIKVARPASSSRDESLNYNDDPEAWYQEWSNHNDHEHDPINCSYIADPFSNDLAGRDADSPNGNQGYQVDLSANRYWQKYQDALSKNDAIRADKNKEKYTLLATDDYKGMNRLVARYKREYENLRNSNVNDRSKAGWASSSSSLWQALACALSRANYEPLGLPMHLSTTASEEEREQMQALYRQAQEEAYMLIDSRGSFVDFNLINSGNKVEEARDEYRSRGDANSKRKWKKAMKLHEYKVNALMNKSADDANAVALHYGDQVIKSSKLLEKGEEKEDRVRTRRFTWRDRADEIEIRLKKKQ